MQQSDVIILGGGLVGLALAAALDSSGLSATVIDPADPDLRLDAAFDGRTSAVSSSSARMFDAIGISTHFPAPGGPIRQIRTSDGLARVEGQAARAEAGKAITLRYQTSATHIDRGEHGVTVTLDNGETLRAPLLVSAEGRNSATRAAAGIRLAKWSYDHRAIVSILRHGVPHDGIAYEIFYPGGPFALLPMTDDEVGPRSAIVWSITEADAPGLLALTDDQFAAEAQAAMGGFLGPLAMLAPRSSYPLGFHHAARITDQRLALVGDAAHAVHPIAGQGLNLGFRDAAALAQVLVEGARLGLDLGDRQLLDRYQRWRSLDTLMVAMSTDGLNRFYSVPGKTASAVRRFGMGMVDRIAPLKARLMAEARGTSGELPLLLRGLPI
jgi:2-octaprenyl-6-methoxyphenol hydroxylase